jgi:LPXTG-motif cell wall-anchored protein
LEGSLPNTGGPSLVFLTDGLALLIAGASALMVSRRRRS